MNFLNVFSITSDDKVSCQESTRFCFNIWIRIIPWAKRRDIVDGHVKTMRHFQVKTSRSTFWLKQIDQFRHKAGGLLFENGKNRGYCVRFSIFGPMSLDSGLVSRSRPEQIYSDSLERGTVSHGFEASDP